MNIISHEQDEILRNILSAANEYISVNNTVEVAKLLYVPSYYQISYTRLFDIIMSIALKMRGATVIPILTNPEFCQLFFYGGIYHTSDSQGSEHHLMEHYIWNNLLKTVPRYISNFENEEDKTKAKEISDIVTFHNYNDLEYCGYKIGSRAADVVANLNNMPKVINTPGIVDQIKLQIEMIYRLFVSYERIFDEVKPDAVFSNVPFYYKWNVAYHIAKDRQVPFYAGGVADRKKTFAFSYNTEDLHDVSPAWPTFKQKEISQDAIQKLDQLIDSRFQGKTECYFNYQVPGQNTEDHQTFNSWRDAKKPLCFFPVNLLFDAPVYQKAKCFTDLVQMIEELIQYFNCSNKYQLVIKAHPIEALFYKTNDTGQQQYCLANVINKLDVNSDNILFLDYDSTIHLSDIIPCINLGIVYTSSAAMEMSWGGKPVISVAKTHYTEKGFIYEPNNKDEFYALIDFLCDGKEQKSTIDNRIYLSKIYYLLYYYHARIDFNLFEGSDTGVTPTRLIINDIKKLLPGNNVGLDYVCDSIINLLPIYAEDRWPPYTGDDLESDNAILKPTVTSSVIIDSDKNVDTNLTEFSYEGVDIGFINEKTSLCWENIKSNPPRNVVIETSTGCTRICPYCPLSVIERPYSKLADSVVFDLIDQLKDWGFNGDLSFQFINEPLLDSRLIGFIEYAKKQLPEVKLCMATNGDLLSADVALKFLKICDEIRITQHDNDFSRENDINNLLSTHPMLANKLSILRPGWKPQNWGGLITNIATTPWDFFREQCPYFNTLIINAYGQSVQCCQDAEAKHGYGSIYNFTLQDIWKRAEQKRRSLFFGKHTDLFDLCKCCTGIGGAVPINKNEANQSIELFTEEVESNEQHSICSTFSEQVAVPPQIHAPFSTEKNITAELLKVEPEIAAPPKAAMVNVNGRGMKPILGFDSAGEVFTHDGSVYRGVFAGHGRHIQAIYKICRDKGLFGAGIVNTVLVDQAPFNTLGYDLVLQHERVPFISYAHEWTPSMLKDAALFQIDLDLKLLDADLLLKDCGVSTNVLFDGTRPVFVDFLSIIPKDRLTDEEWLDPDPTTRQQYAGFGQSSMYFQEVFRRMFYPGLLFPLYLIHQNKAEATRKRLLDTALNTTGDSITELETFVNASHALHFAYRKYQLLKENALRNEDLRQFLLIQRNEIEELNVSMSQSGYADYYESKGENFDFFPSDTWKPKHWGVYNALQSFKPSTVLDIGANTGWFSILAAKQGAKVVSLDNDIACMDILYHRAKQESLSILPLIVDFLDPTPDVAALAELFQEPHLLYSRFENDVPLLLSAEKRIACDMVIALAIVHHLCLGGGRHLDDVTRQLALFANKHLVLEFVTKDDPLIVGEPDFFKAQHANPAGFDWYSLERCIELLGRFFGTIQQTPLTATRILLVCTNKNETIRNSQIDPSSNDLHPQSVAPTNSDEFRDLKEVLESPPSIYVVGITNICNLHCPLCVTGQRQQKKNLQFMEFSLFEEIIEKIRPYAQLVQLYKWGESLLHPRIIDMLAVCDSYNLNTEISSNLSIENCDQVLEALVKFRLRHLIVSFDGVTQEDYSRYRVGGKLDVVLSNIRKIKEFKTRYNSEYPVISLQFLRNKFTGDQVQVMEDNYRQWGADKYYVCDMTTVFKDRDLDAARQWFSDQEIAQRRYLDIDVSMHGKPCYFLYTTMIIEQDGSMPSCCFATDPKDDFGQWDNKKSILEMYNSGRFIQARRMFREKKHCSGSTCDDCCVFNTYLGEGEIVARDRLPMVSVIIPSYNRAGMLGITIESFINQDYPSDSFEIIIADNNSTDNTKAVVADWQSRTTVPITYLFEQRQGVHYARNSAARKATGEILYFTDDDMIADSRLLAEIVSVFSLDPLVGTVTGRVLPKWEVQPPDWVLQLCYNSLLSIFDSLGDGIHIDEVDFGVYSCHQAILREALFKAGGFNPESTYTDYVGDGETGLSIKLKDNGYKFGYNGKSIIHHMIPASRMTQDYLNKRLANQGSADCYTEYKKHLFSSEQLADRVQNYVSSLIEKSSLCVDKRIDDDIRWRMDKAYAHYYLSRIEYDLRLIKDPDWRELVLKSDWIN